MSTDSLMVSNVYFVAYPDAETAAYLQALIQSWDTNAHVTVTPTLTDLYNQLGAVSDKAIVISELLWDGQDASDVLLSLALNYPRIAFLVATNFDTSQILPQYFPIPYVQGVDRTDLILNFASSLTEDLRGTQAGPYHLIDFAGQNYLGRNYFAHQPLIKRDVHLTVLPLLASEEERQEFRAIAAARARNIHAQIYVIYEEGEADGRPFAAQEPVTAPSLLQLSLQDATFDSRLIAKLLTVTSSVLSHLHSNRIPYQPLRSSHITLAGDGVIKMHNTALPSTSPIPDIPTEIAELADIIREFCPKTDPLDPRLDALLNMMSAGLTNLQAIYNTANAVDLDLAPVKFVPQREQAIKAAAEIKKARKNYLLYTAIIAGSMASLIGFIVVKLILDFAPGTDFRKQCRIPAGKAFVGEQLVDVGEFYMDEHEVTIGQYEKFLKDKPTPAKLLPPDLARYKTDFEPYDWNNIQKALKPGILKRIYLGGVLTRDIPIFNVDYADAYAYAKWKHKRLPTELEWQRAAAGDQNLKYPWGNTADFNKTNTGKDIPRTGKSAKTGPPPGSVDGFPGLAPVNGTPADRSPYGVIGMAGNVSEWVEPSLEFGPFKSSYKNIRGGNFAYPWLFPNQYHRAQVQSDFFDPSVGFRCVSDKPVE
ncbi:MAG: SUMF1/EgtB/PvdO family nonheme iron enzyme [Methylacidiphilales bacterium]|nr:SUMF1/EgtB/PvdO family nonheme iron enzyme [Candidatus Methylacidiphilales bacterium]